MKKLYVGNLAFSATEKEIRELFGQYGSVASVSLITDRETGQPRGFGFVEMEDGADNAIRALDGKEVAAVRSRSTRRVRARTAAAVAAAAAARGATETSLGGPPGSGRRRLADHRVGLRVRTLLALAASARHIRARPF
jgi:hypothetical protein